MTALTILVSQLAAMAVGALWIALDIRHQERNAAQRIEQAISRNLLAPTLELQPPFGRRVLRPLLNQILRRVGRLSPRANIERLRQDLLIAGSPHGLGALDFLGLRFLIAVAGTLLLGAVILQVSGSLARAFLIGVAGAALFSELPSFWLHRRMAHRRKTVMLALPDALDMLTVCVDAGLGLQSAFLRIGQRWNHPLAQEFHRAVLEIGVGISWREAMRNLVSRTDVPELSSLVAVLLQADQLGFSISDTLHAQAEQLRVRRRQRAQEMARAAPLKMLLPMVFFIMPATFAVILGPAIPAILEVLAVP